MISRQKLPDSTVATSAAPLTTTYASSQVRRSPAAGTERRATAIAPARGRNCSTRALHVNSRRFDMFSRHVSRSRRTVRSSQLAADTMTGSSSPAASRIASPWAKSGTSPRPRAFQSVSATSAGASDTRKSGRCVQRRASANATSGPPRNSALAGLNASATPANVPASTASRYAKARSARTVNATETSTATTEGKSACCVSPSACGRNWSTHESW